ncbi:hypothetical protein GmHk_08G023554 [Glycine max]|nr:hypothetical protein GmHk_08G023554 [Glycine max]
MKFTFRTKIICQRKISLPSSLERPNPKEKKRSALMKLLKCRWMSMMLQIIEESNTIICFEYRKSEHMKVEYPQLKKKSYSGDEKKKNDLDSEKSSSSDDEQVNIYLMINTDEKVDVKTCYEFETSFVVSSDDEEEMPYDIILQNYYDLSSVRKI